MNAPKYLKCSHCGNMFAMVKDSGMPVVCCGEVMEVLIPGPTEHYIEWIALVTDQGYQHKYLKPGDDPVAVFELAKGDYVIAAYEYCNLHGLWRKDA